MMVALLLLAAGLIALRAKRLLDNFWHSGWSQR
jgi:hypothetical protein